MCVLRSQRFCTCLCVSVCVLVSLRVSVCVSVCSVATCFRVCLGICLSVFTCFRVFVSLYVHVSVSVCNFLSTCACDSVCLHMCLFMSLSASTGLYVCLRVSLWMSIYIYHMHEAYLYAPLRLCDAPAFGPDCAAACSRGTSPSRPLDTQSVALKGRPQDPRARAQGWHGKTLRAGHTFPQCLGKRRVQPKWAVSQERGFFCKRAKFNKNCPPTHGESWPQHQSLDLGPCPVQESKILKSHEYVFHNGAGPSIHTNLAIHNHYRAPTFFFFCGLRLLLSGWCSSVAENRNVCRFTRGVLSTGSA